VKEPGSEYLGHVAPPSGTSINLSKSLIDFLTDHNVSTDHLVAAGCDGTNVNTGVDGGVIRLLEKHCKKSLHWFVCLLHMNELPLRHLLIHVDGVTHGPKSFSGPIGKAIQTCLKPVKQFKRIEGKSLPEVDVKDLSNDQHYLYRMTQAVTSGECPQQLADCQPGPLAHSRWLTTASRILRLYVAEKTPSANLVTIVTYIVRVYTPMWFEIKTKPSCSDGARHVWKLISYSRYLEGDLKAVVDKVIQRNAYFAHSENLLLSMLSNEREFIRKVAYRRILAARAMTKKGKQLKQAPRTFQVPTINFAAEDYTDLIDWMATDRLEPPATTHKRHSTGRTRRLCKRNYGCTMRFFFRHSMPHTGSRTLCSLGDRSICRSVW
jgi:hypothetical protein